MAGDRPTLRVAAAAAALVLGALAGCEGPAGDGEPLRVGPMEAFAREVQPHLAERCASGGCHGTSERPLSLYASGVHRADPSRVHLDEPLTDRELAANARRLAAFAHQVAPERSLALRKPLAKRSGGCWHGGGEVFADRTDPAYRILDAWLAMPEYRDGGTR